MAVCGVCGKESVRISRSLGVCAGCVLTDSEAARSAASAAHERSRREFGLPPVPPRDPGGIACGRCVNACRIGPGAMGYCGVRRHEDGALAGGDADAAAVQWYHDPLPTNCVADWVCPASGPAGYPAFTDTEGPEYGHDNLAVFYEACSFDCLFCQNWHFRSHSVRGPRHRAAELADAVTPKTRCICYFGGDPSCQVEHALAASRLARERNPGRILRICWETNGSVSRPAVDEMAALSLESGGCVKFDLKAWDEPLHRALCGASNRRTLSHFEHLARLIERRPDPPLLIASTLLVPGYVEAEQVGRIAAFIARLDSTIPYALLGFHPAFEMSDLPATSRRQAAECLGAAETAGLRRVRIGNRHVLT